MEASSGEKTGVDSTIEARQIDELPREPAAPKPDPMPDGADAVVV